MFTSNFKLRFDLFSIEIRLPFIQIATIILYSHCPSTSSEYDILGFCLGDYFPFDQSVTLEEKKILKLHACASVFSGTLPFLHDAETKRKQDWCWQGPGQGLHLCFFQLCLFFSFNDIVFSDSRGSHTHTSIM